MMGHLIWISPTEQAKGNSGKEPKTSIKWPDSVLKLHQMTQWRKKKPWENPGSIGGQFSSGVYELEAKFTVTVR